VVIGKIDYLNLLPFHLFIKRYNIKTKEGYPSQINRMFDKKLVEAGFISSIKSKNKKCFDVGIIANKKVMSVLVCEGKNRDDFESNTSNVLAKILHIKGEVIIGDKALQIYFKDLKNCKDLANEWYKKYKLPFVVKSHSTAMVKRTNGLSGESIELPGFAAAVYDYTIYKNHMAEELL